MRIGYSCWGFVGEGVVNTPDGGRSHRRTLLEALGQRGHQLVLLQPDRDRLEAGQAIDLGDFCSWSDGFPDIDLLWLEWRWPIRGRNTPADRSQPGFTPDRDRQTELLRRYTDEGLPTLIWDKDLQLAEDDRLRLLPNVVVCEAALCPRGHARRLLFPVDDAVLDAAQQDPSPYFGQGELDLVYVGNRYGRDAAFDRYFAPAAAHLDHRVYGKWEGVERWPGVEFAGRVGFGEVTDLYRSALATVLILPPRYVAAGQMTQRIFEAALSGCFPLLPREVRGASAFVPPALQVGSGEEVASACQKMRAATSEEISELAQRCLSCLDLFRASRQLRAIDDLVPQESFS